MLVASTDHEELVRLCHRVLVMRRGRIVDEISGGRMDHDVITAATIGRDQAAARPDPHQRATLTGRRGPR